MQIGKSYFFQRFQRFADLRSLEKFSRLCDRQVHHLCDIFSFDLILQHFFGIPQSLAHITGGFDIVHKCHIRYDHTFSLTCRALSGTVKGEQRSFFSTALCKDFPDLISDAQISRRSRTKACTCCPLAYKHHFFSHAAIKAFHQRAFSRARNSGDHNQIFHRKFHCDILQIVKVDMLHPPFSFCFSCLFFERSGKTQLLSGWRIAFQELLITAFK